MTQLAEKVHQSKVVMDQALWGPAGLPTDPQALSRTMQNLRRARGPGSTSLEINNSHLKTVAYRHYRSKYILAKVELGALKNNREIPKQIEEARWSMENRFRPALNKAIEQDQLLDLANESALQELLAESISEAVAAMKRDRSPGAVLAVVETIAASDELGYGNVQSEKRRAAWDSALNAVKMQRQNAEKQLGNNPKSQILRREQALATQLCQYLGM